MSTYKIILDDGSKIDVFAYSAAQAIYQALKLNRGRKVVECYLGMKQEDVDALRRMDKTATPSVGFVQMFIPPHDALPHEVPVHPVKKDKSTTLFDDEEILRESENARRKQEGPNFD